MQGPQLLSKDEVLAGLRCRKLLWWAVHEPGAPELKPSDVLLDRFDQGREVGKLARQYVPGGELIGTPFLSLADRFDLTRRAVQAGDNPLYEAAFEADGVVVLVDILERTPDGFVVIEVKASTELKKKHIPEIALQVHVARRTGLPVHRAELMHLNKGCRYPNLQNLFVREDVTGEVETILLVFPAAIPAELETVRGNLPEVQIGDHCTTPERCPFMGRCWPPQPKYHIRTLHNVRKKKLATLTAMGVTSIAEIPDDFELNEINCRQRQAIRGGLIVVEPSLARVLVNLREPLAFLDFETLSRAIPIWDGCAPWEHVPAQLSCHVRHANGQVDHHEWLVNGPGDPRRELAERLLDACGAAPVVVAYFATFERDRILGLASTFPDLRAELLSIAGRLVDLWPIVRDHVYDPAFEGGFSLKVVAPTLVPELTYEDLAIASGGDATIELARLALSTDVLTETERANLRRELLEYCKRDTWCLVRLLDRLRELAAGAP